jgi:cytochrome c553
MNRIALMLVAALAATSALANPTATKGDPRAAEAIVNQVCLASHGADGNTVAAANPKLAGMNEEYLYKQLSDFKSGARKNPIMNGMVKDLTDADLKNLAAYYSLQQPKPGTAKDAELAQHGEKIYRGGVLGAGVPACASCHGPQGKGIPTQFPRLAGQHADYTYAQLNAFRVGARANDAAKMMRTIAAKMTDADMKAVATYIQGLR